MAVCATARRSSPATAELGEGGVGVAGERGLHVCGKVPDGAGAEAGGERRVGAHHVDRVGQDPGGLGVPQPLGRGVKQLPGLVTVHGVEVAAECSEQIGQEWTGSEVVGLRDHRLGTAEVRDRGPGVQLVVGRVAGPGLERLVHAWGHGPLLVAGRFGNEQLRTGVHHRW